MWKILSDSISVVFLYLQAASISRSLSRAKIAAEKGRVNCRELRDSVVKAIEEAGGRVDYAEVTTHETPFWSQALVSLWHFQFGLEWIKIKLDFHFYVLDFWKFFGFNTFKVHLQESKRDKYSAFLCQIWMVKIFNNRSFTFCFWYDGCLKQEIIFRDVVTMVLSVNR